MRRSLSVRKSDTLMTQLPPISEQDLAQNALDGAVATRRSPAVSRLSLSYRQRLSVADTEITVSRPWLTQIAKLTSPCSNRIATRRSRAMGKALIEAGRARSVELSITVPQKQSLLSVIWLARHGLALFYLGAFLRPRATRGVSEKFTVEQQEIQPRNCKIIKSRQKSCLA
jgi:hypothetical protein